MPIQASSSVLVVSPKHFCSNVDIFDNKFSSEIFSKNTTLEEIKKSALNEQNNLCTELKKHGVNVVQMENNNPEACDAVFPNNQFVTMASSSSNGDSQSKVTLFPMKYETRRIERTPEIVEFLNKKYDRLVDMSHYETSPFKINEVDASNCEQKAQDLNDCEVAYHSSDNSDSFCYLEGTGSMVLDRCNRRCYVALSHRSHLRLVRIQAKENDYSIITFHSYSDLNDLQNSSIYHTNVMMSVGSGYVIICLESIPDSKERQDLIESFQETGHEVIDISLEQVREFCGNCLEVLNSKTHQNYLFMSKRARSAFSSAQIKTILKYVNEIVDVDMKTIEYVGGGGVRCCLAELF